MKSTTFDIFAGWCAVVGGLVAFLYAVSFVVVARSAPEVGALLSALFLMLVGLLTSVALTAVYSRVRTAAPELGLWAFLLGIIGTIGSAIHGSYDLANAIHPSAAVLAQAQANLPSEIDPRGFVTFGLGGLALLTLAWLIVRSRRLPRGLGYLGYVLAALLLVLYLARLIVLDASSLAILLPAVLSGFILTPVWYIWLGLALWRQASS